MHVPILRVLLFVIALSPLSSKLHASPGPEDECERILTNLFKTGDALQDLENLLNEFRIDPAGRLPQGQLNYFVSKLRSVQPTPYQSLQLFDSLIQSAISLAQFGWLTAFTPEILSNYKFVISELKSALQNSGLSRKKIIATIRADWREREKGTLPFGLDFSLIHDRVEDTKALLKSLARNPEVFGASVPLDRIDNAFFLKEVRALVASLDAENPDRLAGFDPALPGWAPVPLPELERNGFLNWAHQDRNRWLSYFDENLENVETRANQAAFYAFLSHLALARNLRDWAGLQKGDLNDLQVFKVLDTIADLNFSQFNRLFPSRTHYSEKHYLAGANSDFEKSIVKALYKDRHFKKELFESLQPDWIHDPVMRSWLNFASLEKVDDLLSRLGRESRKTVQTANRYLRETLKAGFKVINADESFRVYYGDEIIRVLTRLSAESNGQLNDPELRDLKNRLRIAFISRTPDDLNLGRRTGDCTSFRSVSFAGSLRWFASPAAQIVTFSVGSHFLGKAHLVLLDGPEPLLAVDAIEINPQANINAPLHGLLRTHLPRIFDELGALAVRLQRRLVMTELSNTAFMVDYLQQFPFWRGEEDFLPAEIPIDRQAVRAFLEKRTGMKLGPPPLNPDDETDGELFLQSFSWVDEAQLKTFGPEREKQKLKSNRNLGALKALEDELQKELETLGGGLPRELQAYEFASLASQDPMLDEFDREFRDHIEASQLFDRELADDFEYVSNTPFASEAARIAEALASQTDFEFFYNTHYGVPLVRIQQDAELFRLLTKHRIVYHYYFKRFEAAREEGGPAYTSGFNLRTDLRTWR